MELLFLTVLLRHSLVIDQADIVGMSLRLINGMTLISTARQWLSVSLLLMDMSQCLVQGLYFHDSPLQQLPFVNVNAVKALKGKEQNQSISQFVDMDREDRVTLLKDKITDDQIDQVIVVAKQYPELKVLKAFFKGKHDYVASATCTPRHQVIF